MKRLLLAVALVATGSAANAQRVNNDVCVVTSDGTVCGPIDQVRGVLFEDGLISLYLYGQDSPWIRLFNPNNPRTNPGDPYYPGDPYKPILLVRPGS